ncbi:hypothetical protein G6L37_06270 [Agrobacterium rubi]|nr:hypothetical protein [Agrobacterium rubi]NTF24967.1 hypothetical protein [Agrobacterium rubi]
MADQSEFEHLAATTSQRYPQLILDISGPWKNRDGSLVDKPWICNFRNWTQFNQNVHPGSSGVSMLDALRQGLKFLDADPDNSRVRNLHSDDSQSS